MKEGIKNLFFYSIIFVFSFLTLNFNNCVKEKITKPGTVPPPRQNNFYQEKPLEIKVIHSQSESQKGREKQEILKKFRLTYTQQGEPRIVIFVNKKLSDEISEWEVNSVNLQQTSLELEGSGNVYKYEPEENKDKDKVTSEESFKYENKLKVKEKVSSLIKPQQNTFPTENTTIWKFENNFIKPFLEAKVNIVDRNVIIRLMGLSEMQNKPIDEIDIKSIEMQALKEYADIYIELLINKDINSPTGYIFKAKAIDIKTGKLLAYAVSSGISGKETEDKKVEVTSHGFEITKESMTKPSLEESSKELAFILMEQLAEKWGNKKNNRPASLSSD